MREGGRATLAGRVTMVSVAARPDPPHRAYRYPRLMLAQPICLASRDRTDAQVSVVALAGDGTIVRTGQRLSRTGTLWFTTTADQPPDDVMLLVRP
jgi:hypothetical protein